MAIVIKEHQFFSSGDMAKLVNAKYPGPAYAVLNELRDGTGFGTAGRSADAIAFGTWPSRGLQIIGFEFKSYRSDWLNELKNPAKAESIGRFCNAWYLVAAENVARLEEIPPAWGWYVPTAKGLKCLKAPTDNVDPTPISKIFLMSIMRSLEKNYVPKRDVDAQVEMGIQTGLASKVQHLEHTQKEFNKLRQCVNDFKQASGLDIEHTWQFPPKELGKAVKAVIEHDRQLQAKIDHAKGDFDRLKTMLDSLEALRLLEPFKEHEILRFGRIEDD